MINHDMTSDSQKTLDLAKKEISEGGYDSAILKLDNLVSLEPETSAIHVEALLLIGLISWQRGVYHEATEILASAEKLGRKHGFKALQAEAIRVTGNVLSDLGQNAEAEIEYNKALSIFEKINDLSGIGRCFNNLGVTCAERGDYEGALEFYEKSLKTQREVGNDMGIAIALNNIGEVHRFRGDYDEAERLFEESLKMDEARGDTYGQAICWGNLGAVSAGKKNYEEAEKRVKTAVVIFEKLGTFDNVYVEIRGSLVGIMAATRRFPEGQANLHEIQKAAKKIRSDYSTTVVEFYSGLLAQKQGNLSFARQHYTHCIEYAQRGTSFEYELLSLIQMVELELQNYRLTFENEFLEEMEKKLKQVLELAAKTNSFGALAELTILSALLCIENQDPRSALEELSRARKICIDKGFARRTDTIDRHVERIERSLESSSGAQPQSVEDKVRRMHKYIEECQRLVLASK